MNLKATLAGVIILIFILHPTILRAGRSAETIYDNCHSKGIAVVMDIALNHSFGLAPMVQLYWMQPHKGLPITPGLTRLPNMHTMLIRYEP
jgi:hypothetical protein